MDLLKTPHEKLMEDAGLAEPSPGLLNTPKQLLMQEIGGMPHFAAGGQLSPQDMLAELIVNNMEPEHFREGGPSLAKKISHALKQHPLQSLFNLMNLSDVAENSYDAARHAAAGRTGPALESGLNAMTSIPAAIPSMPLRIGLGVPYGGQALSEQAATHMAQNPQFRSQMQDMSQSPLGGALGGDAALAAQIMGDRDYSDVLQSRLPVEEEQAAEPAPRRVSPLYQKTMVVK